MIADAFRAELFRASRHRVALFWTFGFVPLFMLLTGFVLEAAIRGDALSLTGGTDPLQLALRSFAMAGNPIAALFFAIGAAGLFANDYRWESWRLATPRNSRPNLILARFMVFALFAAGSLLLAIFTSVVPGFYQPLRFGAPVIWPQDATGLVVLLTVYAGSLTEMLVTAAIAALGAVLTRSLLGGALPAFLLTLVQTMALGYFAGPPKLNRFLFAPSQAGDAIRGWGFGNVTPDTALAAAAILAGWSVMLIGAVVLLFDRQDLARE